MPAPLLIILAFGMLGKQARSLAWLRQVAIPSSETTVCREMSHERLLDPT